MTTGDTGSATRRPAWRPLACADLRRLERIAAAVHPDLPERPDVFAEKLRLDPHGCFALDLAGEMVGYAICHAWTLDDIPALDAFLTSLPASPDCLYVHDVAILPDARGHRSLVALIDILSARCARDRLPAMSLVSVYATRPVWEAVGFRDAPGAPARKSLAGYGPGARYMIRRTPA